MITRPGGSRLIRARFLCRTDAKTDTSAIQLLAEDATIAVTDPVYPVYVDANAMAEQGPMIRANGSGLSPCPAPMKTLLCGAAGQAAGGRALPVLSNNPLVLC